MKSILCLTMLLSVVNACKAKVSSDPFKITKGTQLIYEVNSRGMIYNFIVDIEKASDEGIDFSWKMTDPINYSGKISIAASALVSSNKLYNYFSNHSYETLTDQTSVFLSNALYEGLKNDRYTVNMGTGEELLIGRRELFKGYKVNVNGKETALEFYDANNVETNHVLRFTKIGNYQLILEMHTEFSIVLKEVKDK